LCDRREGCGVEIEARKFPLTNLGGAQLFGSPTWVAGRMSGEMIACVAGEVNVPLAVYVSSLD
jgi:hypothetical protein